MLAVAQISLSLIEHPDFLGFVHPAMLLAAIWWVWVYGAGRDLGIDLAARHKAFAQSLTER